MKLNFNIRSIPSERFERSLKNCAYINFSHETIDFKGFSEFSRTQIILLCNPVNPLTYLKPVTHIDFQFRIDKQTNRTSHAIIPQPITNYLSISCVRLTSYFNQNHQTTKQQSIVWQNWCRKLNLIALHVLSDSW